MLLLCDRPSAELSSRRPSCKAISGFTLLELLVSISILLVLSGLLYGAIRSIGQRARAVACSKQLLQLGLAVQMYAVDNDEKFVPYAAPHWSSERDYWYQFYDLYMDGTGVLASSASRSMWQQCPSKRLSPGVTNIGFGWNFENFGYRTGVTGCGENSSIPQVSKPSQTIIAGDSPDLQATGFEYKYLYIYKEFSEQANRHSGRGNYLFVDGHVESLLPGFNSWFLIKVK